MNGDPQIDVQMLIGLAIYMTAIVSMGLWYSRKGNKNPEEYFLAKRRFGPWLTSLSAQASDMSGWLLMGLPGVAYFLGLGEALWTALGLFIGTCINWSIVAKRLRSYSQVANSSITLPEFFSKRFHDEKRILLAVAAVICLLFFSIYVGSQLVVVGTLFENLFGLNMALMVVIGAVVILSYTLIGGFLGVGATDVAQGLLMATSLTLVMVFGFFHAGGISGIAANLQEFPGFLEFFGVARPEIVSVPVLVDGIQQAIDGIPQYTEVQQVINGTPIFNTEWTRFDFIVIISIMAWGLGYFGMPQVLVRFMAVNKTSNLRPARIIAITWVFVAMFAAIAIGIMGRAIMPTELLTAREAESIFILLSQSFLPSLIAGLIISGILAASMSSSDSFMLIVSSSLANDIYKGVINKNAKEKTVMWIARGTMLAVTIFGIVVAVTGTDTIFQLVAYAWAGLGASFGPLVLFSLFWKRTTFQGALAGMITGGVMVVLWRNVISDLHYVLSVYELLPAFIISSLVILFVSLATKKPSAEIEAEFEQAKVAQI